jgi:hypothetical protein
LYDIGDEDETSHMYHIAKWEGSDMTSQLRAISRASEAREEPLYYSRNNNDSLHYDVQLVDIVMTSGSRLHTQREQRRSQHSYVLASSLRKLVALEESKRGLSTAGSHPTEQMHTHSRRPSPHQGGLRDLFGEFLRPGHSLYVAETYRIFSRYIRDRGKRNGGAGQKQDNEICLRQAGVEYIIQQQVEEVRLK